MSDRERLSDLANAALAGDERAYGMLVGALWPNAYRIAWSILGDPSAAEDAAQSACIAICAKLRDINDCAPSLAPASTRLNKSLNGTGDAIMNEDQQFKNALGRRFARVTVPECPNLQWGSMAAVPARQPRRSRRYAYVFATLLVLIGGGVAAQASGALGAGYADFFNSGSSKPLPPLIHRADRLTVAQAQQQVPFSVVVPVGLPPNSTLEYAHVVREQPVPNVALYYQTQIGGRYYRVIISETTAVPSPAVAHFEVEGKGKDGRMQRKTWTLPLRVWKHGAIFMETPPQGLPPAVVDRIVRENTL